jgi:hypothetical protein
LTFIAQPTAFRYAELEEFRREPRMSTNRPRLIDRRAVLRGLAAGSIIAAGIGFLEPMTGRRTPAAGAYQTCSISGLSFASNCLGANYSTTCSNGCARQSSASSSVWCKYTSFNSRHRTCGENRTVDSSLSYHHWTRKDECYSGGYDGWQWCGTDSGSPRCSCGTVRCFSCNDGFYQLFYGGTPAGALAKSICMQSRCIP